MSIKLLERVSTNLVTAGLLEGLKIRFYRWTDDDLKGTAGMVLFKMSGTSGARNSVVQQPDVTILLVGSGSEVRATNDIADDIFSHFAGMERPEGVLKFEPLMNVPGPFSFDNGRIAFQINVRCFVQDM